MLTNKTFETVIIIYVLCSPADIQTNILIAIAMYFYKTFQ